MMARTRPLHIGISPRIFHPDEQAQGLFRKTLQYLEQSVAHWVMSRDVLLFMLPTINKDGRIHRSNMRLSHYAEYLDGLVLQGGHDISPTSYGEEPLHPDWQGDAVRDAFELELLHEFIEARRPVLGICRGMQLINVAFGGTLYQDLPTQIGNAVAHQAEAYDKHAHNVVFEPGSAMAGLFGDKESGPVVSIHHQAVHALGRDIAVDARADDGVIEAIRWKGRSFVVGLQWHPEFHHPGDGTLDCTPILDEFLHAARRRRW